jgi:hypothetical protein
MAASRDFPALAGVIEIDQVRPEWNKYVAMEKVEALT